jgi:hypothetical protein
MLREELDRPVRGPVNANLGASKDSEAILQADLCAGVETEEVFEQAPEISISEGARKSVRDAEGALVPGHTQRRRQRHEGKVGLREVDVEIWIILRGSRDREGQNQSEDSGYVS